VAAHYRDISQSIEAYKYRSDRQHGDLYVDLLAKVVEKYGLLSFDDIALVSVPMHWSRYLIRGFNHIDFLVSRLSRGSRIPHIRPIRAHWTRRQSKLTKVKRMKNREHAFALKSGVHLPKTVILIDDIISTGSTLDACAKILKSVGVERIYGVCIASNQ
jgi:ComF family protein